MRLSGPLMRLVAGTLLGLSALWPDVVFVVLTGLGVAPPPWATALLPIGMAVTGAGLFAWGLWTSWVALDGGDERAKWLEALADVATEYGASLSPTSHGGVSLTTTTDGVRLEVSVQPQDEQVITVWYGQPAQQDLLITVVAHDGTGGESFAWRQVGRRGRWELRAQTPATARGLLDEVPFVEEMNRLMSRPQVRAIRHDADGVEVLLSLPDPQDASLLVRSALQACRCLARLNG